jgi:hypothetical protein
LFSVLADVRNEFGIKPISSYRGLPEDCCCEFESYSEDWDVDGHSHGWVTLKEMKEYDLDQQFYDDHVVLGRDEKGQITATAKSTTGRHLGEVGKRNLFGTWGRDSWNELIEKLNTVSKGDDESVRLVFFFDN